MRKIILFFLVIITILPAALYAQSVTVTGTIKDVEGVLPGATVYEKGEPANLVITGSTGKFKLTLKGQSNTLVVKFIGYSTQEFHVGARKNEIDIILQPNAEGLDEVAVVGFTKSKRVTSTGSVSSIQAAEIRTVPTANVQNALAGKLPGFFSQQTSGQPGKDASDFFIRGVSSLNASNQPLILVDDIEYTYDQLQQINVNEIESISILKDASSTAIYGIKGANGVLIVTTRRGKKGAPQFNFRVEGGIQSPTKVPKFLDSYQSAQLVDEAETNDGVAPDALTFQPSDLAAFKNNTDPYGHPNTDWYDDIFRKYTYQANTNLDISGGNDRVKYFISGGAFTQNGNTKNFNDPQDLVNTNYYFTRYDFRSNLDLKANKTLDLRLDVTTRFGDLNAPGLNSPVGTIYDFKTENPFSAPFINPNGTYAYNNSVFNISKEPTLNAQLANGGYQHNRRTDFNVLIGGVQNLSAITDGLTLTARVAFASSEDYGIYTTYLAGNPNVTFPTYYYNSTTKTYTKNPAAPYVAQVYQIFGGTDLYTNNTNIQVFSNYDRTFGDNHFTGLFLINQQEINDQASAPQNYRGLSLKVGYDYKQKYLIEVNSAYNGTDRFAAGHQFGFFPAFGAGYVLSREKFFKDALPTFSLFKLRFSYGVVGSDGAPGNQYIYQQTYNQSGLYGFGETAPQTPITGITEGTLGNPDVVWERDRKADLGVDMNLLHDKLSVTFDLFHDVRYDEFVIPGAIPEVLGVGVPYVNAGRVSNHGYDGQISYHDNIGKVQYNASLVVSYAKNKILYEAETQPAYPNLARTGNPINQPFGYHFLNYYTQAQINQATTYINTHGNNAPVLQNGKVIASDPIGVPAYADSPNGITTLHAGDLRYQDLNGDGVIDANDQKAIGYPNLPNTSAGLTLGAAYKGFSISVLFQGSWNYSVIITGNGIEPFESQFQPIDLKAWTPATAATAQFPRLSTNFSGTVDSPTGFPSDYWYINARYLRLKTVDIGYQLPTKLLPFHVNNARIYFSAYNLFTWDNFSNKYQQDPEVASNTAGDQYINARVINLGLQLGF